MYRIFIVGRSARGVGIVVRWAPCPACGLGALSSVVLNELGEHARARAGVDECDQVPAESSAGSLVDELRAVGPELDQRGLEILDRERDVVQARSAAVQEARDGAVRPQRTDQLDLAGAHGQRSGLDALVL